MANLFNIGIDQIKHNGNEVVLMKLNGNIVYEKETFRIEYTVYPVDKALGDKDYEGEYCIGLPRIYTDATNYSFKYSKLTITKTDGTTTSDPMTKCNEIEKVTVWYPENTYGISFRYPYTSDETVPVIRKVNYCNVSNFSSTSSMFHNNWIIDINGIDKWKTNKVTNMNNMFYYCGNLTTLDVSNFDTSKVADMSYMFCECYSLTELDIGNWDTSNVTSMVSMFENCNDITTLDIGNWDVSNVIGMGAMFAKCNKLTSLDLSGWRANILGASSMFQNCRQLTELDLSNFDASNMTGMPSNMFDGCESLHTLHLDNCNNATLIKFINYGDLPTNTIDGVTRTIYCKKSQMSGVTRPANWVFSYVYEEEPDVPLYESGQFKNKTAITNVETTVNESHTDLSYMLYNCTSLISVNTEDWDTSNVTDMRYMFYKCTKLTSLDLSNWSVRNVINMNFMFDHCGITTLDISNWLAYPESTAYMFQSCSNLTSLNTSGLRLYSMVNTKYMFANCSSLATLDLSGMSMSSVTDATNMFYNCTALTDFIAPKNIKVSIDFSNCTNLTYDSLVSIFNNLATVTSTQTITISRASFAKITNDGCIAAAGDKGWSLSIN